jgi:hypothetical protein
MAYQSGHQKKLERDDMTFQTDPSRALPVCLAGLVIGRLSRTRDPEEPASEKFELVRCEVRRTSPPTFEAGGVEWGRWSPAAKGRRRLATPVALRNTPGPARGN